MTLRSIFFRAEAKPTPRPDDDFFVGYLPVPPGIATFVRRSVASLLVGAAIVGVGLAGAQGPFDASAFEFGNVRAWDGVVRTMPYPYLAALDGPYLLVGEGKHGAAAEVEGLDGRRVRLMGTLVHRSEGRMVEIAAGTAVPTTGDAPPAFVQPLGTRRLRGRIVDPKCWFGVMNPGDRKVHRACAIRCLSGGIPPVLATDDGAAYLVAGADGRRLNAEVLDLVGLAVEVEGAVERRDGLLVVRAEPPAFRRLP